MKQKNLLLFRLFAVVTAMMCALGIQAAEAYACFTWNSGVLTFYYDSQRNSRPGTTYDLNTGDNDPDWGGENELFACVQEVVFDPSFAGARPTSTYSWFTSMFLIESITGLNYLNTSEVTNMSKMFAGCNQLTSLDLSHFNTSKVTDMSSMFYGCSSLTSLDLSSFNTSKVTDMGGMFSNCSSLTSLDLSSFNTSQVTNMGSMFYQCTNLKTIYVGYDWSTAAVTYSIAMFYNCTSLVGGQGTTYNSTTLVNKDCAHIDGGPSNPGYFTAATEAYACYTPSNTTLTFYYDNQRSSRPGTTYRLNTGDNDPDWKIDGININVTKVVFDPSFAGARPTTTNSWFYGMVNLQSITGMSYLNTSEVTDMAWMFYDCNCMENPDLSHFNTENVTIMNGMFAYCENLTNLAPLDLSSFNTSKVTDMVAMFAYCVSLTSLDLSSFNTSRVTDMHQMFYGCWDLQRIYVGDGWNTAGVTRSSEMFTDCGKLVGEQGTTYDTDHVDKEYAHIDGGPSNPGYLSSEYSIQIDFEKDGIYYWRKNANEVEVTYRNTNYNSYSGEVTIPATVTYEGRTYGVTAIGDNAFLLCTGLTKVTIPNTVTSIGQTAFSGCRSLQTIECLAVTPPTIYSNTFSSYSAVLWVPYGSKATYQAADYWSNFTNILQLPSSYYDFKDKGIYYKYTGYNAVEVVNDGTDGYFCYSGNVEIPETAYDADDGWYYRVSSIGERAFYRCPSLVTVTIPATVDLIHNEAFVDCFDAYPDQSSITCLAQTPPTVSPTAFGSGEQSYVTLYVPYGKKSAYQAAAVWRNFSNIVELNYSFKKDGFYYKITGSNTVSVTYKDANYNTYSGRVLIPRRVTFEDVTYTVTAIDHAAFLGCTGLTSVSIPEMVTSIGNTVFSGCTSLASITIPNSVTSIGVYAFENCTALKEVELGSGLQSIGTYAFHGCTALESGNIKSLAVTPPVLKSNTFDNGHYQGASLYVPYGCYDAYANATYWKNFYDIYELITLDEALNVDGGDIQFTSDGTYPWTGAASDGRAYAVSGNRGVASSTSTLTAEVYVEGNSMLSFDFKAWGEGTNRIFDMCIFLIDGVEQFCYGALDNNWETFNVELAPGAHTLEWRYSKDDSVNPDGDYFAVDNVQIVTYEAYACYTESNTTLTFYYDNQRSSRPGTTYDLNTGGNNPVWTTDGTNANVTKVVFDPSFANARPTTTRAWFNYMSNLQSITGMSYLNTSEVTNMAYMFMDCKKLTSLDLSHFNTTKLTVMGAMFYGCSSLTSLDLSSFDTSKMTNMINMFYGCSYLRTIYVGNGWSTAAVTNSHDMFYGCTRLVGGQGTTYNANYIDKTYAHIDGGPSNPGYFTDKNAIQRGDINGDGVINVADVTALIQIVLNSSPVDLSIADLSGDGQVNVADVTALIQLVLNN